MQIYKLFYKLRPPYNQLTLSLLPKFKSIILVPKNVIFHEHPLLSSKIFTSLHYYKMWVQFISPRSLDQ